MCDPWTQTEFLARLEQVEVDRCSHCLPDCDYIDTAASITQAKFRSDKFLDS